MSFSRKASFIHAFVVGNGVFLLVYFNRGMDGLLAEFRRAGVVLVPLCGGIATRQAADFLWRRSPTPLVT